MKVNIFPLCYRNACKDGDCSRRHVLNKLNIEEYDPNNTAHNQIAFICKDGHNRKDIKEYIERIDELVEQIYGV